MLGSRVALFEGKLAGGLAWRRREKGELMKSQSKSIIRVYDCEGSRGYFLSERKLETFVRSDYWQFDSGLERLGCCVICLPHGRHEAEQIF